MLEDTECHKVQSKILSNNVQASLSCYEDTSGEYNPQVIILIYIDRLEPEK